MVAAVLALSFFLLSPVAAEQVHATSPLVLGETFTIASGVMKEVRRINVYLPPAYAASKDVRLPVLYMPDGGVGEDFVHVAGLVQISFGEFEGFVDTQAGPPEKPCGRSPAARMTATISSTLGGSAGYRCPLFPGAWPKWNPGKVAGDRRRPAPERRQRAAGFAPGRRRRQAGRRTEPGPGRRVEA